MITLHPVVRQSFRIITKGADVLTSLSSILKGHKGYLSLRPHLKQFEDVSKLLSYVSSSLSVPIVVLGEKGKKVKHKMHHYFPELALCKHHIMYSFMPSSGARAKLIVLYHDKGLFYTLARAAMTARSQQACRRFPFRSPFMRSRKLHSEREDMACAVQILTA